MASIYVFPALSKHVCWEMPIVVQTSRALGTSPKCSIQHASIIRSHSYKNQTFTHIPSESNLGSVPFHRIFGMCTVTARDRTNNLSSR